MEQLRLVDVVGAWFVARVPDGSVLAWSPELAALVGGGRRGSPRGIAVGELLQDPQGEGESSALRELLELAAMGRPIPPRELTLAAPAGPRRFLCSFTVFASQGRQARAGVLCQLLPPPEPPGSGRARRMRLTARQLEILTLIVEGVSTDDIALELGLRPHTVRNHVRGLLGRLGVGTRLEAAVLAVRRGMV